MKLPLLLAALTTCLLPLSHAADSKVAGQAINELGLDLYRTEPAGQGNLLLSPYSIQAALTLAYAGASGDTHAEMQRVLHYPASNDAWHHSLAALNGELADAVKQSATRAEHQKKFGGARDPLRLKVANRLYGQAGYAFRVPYLALLKDQYAAPLQVVDFKASPDRVREAINRWVQKQTHDRIRDLLQSGTIGADSRLVLVNALYMRAAWEDEFSEGSTEPETFFANGRAAEKVPTMSGQFHCGYIKRWGYRIVTLRYEGGDLQFVIILPDSRTGLASLERKITPKLLGECSDLNRREVILHLPKFRMAPPTTDLASKLQGLGLNAAFDLPSGSANFDGIALRKAGDYLAIAAVAHKTFLELDEKGTEAAATTAVEMVAKGIVEESTKPEVVRVDRPFLFAIQHVRSGACLFLGRMNDPR